jgi:hypothetical protein
MGCVARLLSDLRRLKPRAACATGAMRRRHQHPVSLFGCLTGARPWLNRAVFAEQRQSIFSCRPTARVPQASGSDRPAGPSARAITPAAPRRKAPTAVFTAHFPPHNRNGWTAGHSDTVSHSHIDPSPGAGGLPSAIPPPRRLAGCSWVLGPPNFCSALGTPPRGCLPDG